MFVGELAEVADALPLLAAEAEPPAGFEQRVLSALKAPRWRNRRRVVAAIAVAVAAATIVTIVGVRIVESSQETTGSRAAASAVRSVEMMGANGLNVGNVFATNGEPATVVVNVNYAVSQGTYGIEYRAGSTTKRLGVLHTGQLPAVLAKLEAAGLTNHPDWLVFAAKAGERMVDPSTAGGWRRLSARWFATVRRAD